MGRASSMRMTEDEQALIRAVADADAGRAAAGPGDALDALDVLDAYRVYADWLQERGDPRGELIAVQLRLEAGDDGALRERERSLLAPVEAALLGELAGPGRTSAIEWRLGFARSLRLDVSGLGADAAAARIRAVLARPAAGLVRAVELAGDLDGDAGVDGDADTDIRPLVDALAGLDLRAFAPEVTSRAAAAAVCAARWPRLERLVVRTGPDADVTLADIEPVLAGAAHPGVRELGVLGAAFTDALVVRLPYTPLGPRLRALGLSFGLLGDEGREAFSRHRELYRHMALFDAPAVGAGDVFARGHVLGERLARPADALPLYREAIAREPGRAVWWQAVGDAHHALEQYDDAERAYRRALLLVPDGTGAWFGHAQALERLGRADEALADYERAGAADPAAAPPLARRAEILARRGDLDGALACLRQARALAPRDGRVTARLAFWLVHAGHIEEALPCFDTLIELEPEEAGPGLDKGWALLRLGRASEALPYFEAARRRQPDWEYAHAGVGLALAGQGDPGRHDRALACYRRARTVTRCPAIAAMTWLSEAIALLAAGRDARAVLDVLRCGGAVEPARLIAAIATAANAERAPDADPVRAACKGDPTEDRIECALIAVIAAMLAGADGEARARLDALLAEVARAGADDDAAAPAVSPWPWLHVEVERASARLAPPAVAVIRTVHAWLEGRGGRGEVDRAIAVWSRDDA